MMRATELAHLLMRQPLEAGDWAVDATVGNGHDTLLLAELVGPSGRVLGFDVQDAALAAAAERADGLPQVRLVHAGHEKLAEHLPGNGPASGHDQLAAVMFNLGYLPGGAKHITTRPETTLAGLGQALEHLQIHGLVTLVLYPGHPGGTEESAAVKSYAQGLTGNFAVTQHSRINALRPAPELLVIERLG
jgi:SAM-dependent methyltransferase